VTKNVELFQEAFIDSLISDYSSNEAPHFFEIFVIEYPILCWKEHYHGQYMCVENTLYNTNVE
jgi:hypothetical protein